MRDPRYEELARMLVGYSVTVKKGERVLVETVDVPEEMVVAVIHQVVAVGGIPLASTKQNPILKALYETATEEGMRAAADYESARMREMDVYIGIRGSQNSCELAEIPPERMSIFRSHWYGPVHLEVRVPSTRWVVLRFPNPTMAQMADMSTGAFEDFFFKVCTADYGRMSKAMDPLKTLMERTDRVRLTGSGTDLSFSIRDMGAVKCDGRQNLPDGELFTAPVRDSVEGEISFETPCNYQGISFNDIRLRFERGKVVDASANKTDRLLEVLDQDEGARYLGEFSLSFNPFILKPIQDTLFDEKIAGAFHIALGAAYEETDNGNHSNIHWDLVKLQDAESGGGCVFFDDVLIRRDGRFVIDELMGLNPENLK